RPNPRRSRFLRLSKIRNFARGVETPRAIGVQNPCGLVKGPIVGVEMQREGSCVTDDATPAGGIHATGRGERGMSFARGGTGRCAHSHAGGPATRRAARV